MHNFYKFITAKKKLLLVPLLIEDIINFKRMIRTIRVILVGLVFIVSPLLFAWTVALVPDSSIEETISSIEETIKFDLRRSIPGCFFKDWWKEYTYSCTIIESIKGERFINIQNETITLREPPPEIVGAIIQIDNKSHPEVHCDHVGKLDLAGRRLFYANFSGSKFKCVNMEGVQLNGSILVRANLSTANLVNANLTKADLSYSILSNADLRWATLITTILNEANLRKADLKHADLSGAVLYEADLSGADLYNSDLSDADLIRAKLTGAVLRSANLSIANFSSADLSRADLSGADLSSAVVTRINHAVIRRVIQSELDMSEDDLKGFDTMEILYRIQSVAGPGEVLNRLLRPADLSGANLSGAILRGANLREANFRGANLNNTDLKGANLIGADLSGATMNRAKLHRTDLSRAQMYGTRLYGAQLRGTILKDTKLCGANFSWSTPRDTILDNVDGKRPEGWGDILENIESDLRAAGYLEKIINAHMTMIKCICDSDLGYVSPTGVNHCGL